MHKKCSRCKLVNWPQEVQCRRCGHPLPEAEAGEATSLRAKLQATALPSSPADDAALAEAKEMIKKGVNAGMFYGGISLLLVLVLGSVGAMAGDYTKYALLDVGIIYGLTYGMHLKSRVCAGLMLGYYIVSKLVLLTQGTIGIVGVFVAIAFVRAFYQSLQGTILYHQSKRAQAQHQHI